MNKQQNESSETMKDSQCKEWWDLLPFEECFSAPLGIPHFPREAVPEALADVADAFANAWKVSFEAALTMTVFLIAVALGRTVRVEDREGRWHSLRFSALLAEPYKGHTRLMVAKMLHIFFDCRRSHLNTLPQECGVPDSGHATESRTGKQDGFTFKTHQIDDRVQALYSNGNGFDGFANVKNQERGVFLVSAGNDELVGMSTSGGLPPFECTLRFEDAATYCYPPPEIENLGHCLSASVLTEATDDDQITPWPYPDALNPEILLRGVMEKAFVLRGQWSKGGHYLRLSPFARSVQMIQKYFCMSNASDWQSFSDQFVSEAMLDTYRSMAAIFHLFMEGEEEAEISLNAWTSGASMVMCMQALTAHKVRAALARRYRELAVRIVQHADELGTNFTFDDVLEASWVEEEDGEAVFRTLQELVGYGWIRAVNPDQCAEDLDTPCVFHPSAYRPTTDSTTLTT